MSVVSCALSTAGVLAGGWLARRWLSARADRQSCLILALLREQDDLLGSELVARSAGMLGRGTVYVLLERLEGLRVIESRLEDWRGRELRRRIYKLTPGGRRVAERLADGLVSP